jgi:hypothetical protein
MFGTFLDPKFIIVLHAYLLHFCATLVTKDRNGKGYSWKWQKMLRCHNHVSLLKYIFDTQHAAFTRLSRGCSVRFGSAKIFGSVRQIPGSVDHKRPGKTRHQIMVPHTKVSASRWAPFWRCSNKIYISPHSTLLYKLLGGQHILFVSYDTEHTLSHSTVNSCARIWPSRRAHAHYVTYKSGVARLILAGVFRSCYGSSGGTESLKKEASHLNLMSIFKKSRTRLPWVRVIWRVITDDSLNDSP